MKKNSILEQLKAKEQQDLEEAEKFAQLHDLGFEVRSGYNDQDATVDASMDDPLDP